MHRQVCGLLLLYEPVNRIQINHLEGSRKTNKMSTHGFASSRMTFFKIINKLTGRGAWHRLLNSGMNLTEEDGPEMRHPCGFFLPAALTAVFLCAGTAWASAGTPGWMVLDRIVAVVGDEPVLLSDLLMENDLGLLEPANDRAGQDALLEPFLNRLMIIREVDEAGSFRLSSGQIDAAFKGYLSRFSSRKAFDRKLQRWGIDEKEVARRLAEGLIASLYTESRIRFFVGVLPSDITREYNDNPGRWGGRGINEAWNDIKDFLKARAFQKEMDRWLATLRARYGLKIIKWEGDNGS